MSQKEYYRLAPPAFQPEKIVLPGLDEIVSLGETATGPTALGRTNGALRLLRKDAGEWKPSPLPEELQRASNLKLTPSTDGVVAILDDGSRKGVPTRRPSVYRFSDSQWTNAPFPDQRTVTPHFYAGFGQVQLLYGSKLFAGWTDAWGLGALRFVSLDKLDDGWTSVSGKEALDDAGIPGFNAITGMAVDRGGNLCVCEGSHGLNKWVGNAYRYDGKKWTAIINGEPRKAGGAKASFHGEKSDLLDIVAAPDGKLYLLAGKLGIFTYQDEALKPVVQLDFYDITKSYPTMYDGKPLTMTSKCQPQRLVVDAAGDLFVSTGEFGMLCFVPGNAGYRLKQVILPGSIRRFGIHSL
jgi:hypothetical protein